MTLSLMSPNPHLVCSFFELQPVCQKSDFFISIVTASYRRPKKRISLFREGCSQGNTGDVFTLTHIDDFVLAMHTLWDGFWVDLM